MAHKLTQDEKDQTSIYMEAIYHIITSIDNNILNIKLQRLFQGISNNTKKLSNTYEINNQIIKELIIKHQNFIIKYLIDKITYQKFLDIVEPNKYLFNLGQEIAKIAIYSEYQTLYAGAYKIENKITGGIYIGESLNIFKRFKEHINDLKNNNHHCKKLQMAFNQRLEYHQNIKKRPERIAINRALNDFSFVPLYISLTPFNQLYEIKTFSLYLEAGYYTQYEKQQKEIYNTINPYKTLIHSKENYKDEIIISDCFTINKKLILQLIELDVINLFK